MLLFKNFVLIIIGILFNISCDDHKKAYLELEASYKIDVSEPSGLAINDLGTELYTVSDRTSRVYRLSLTGDVIKKYDFKGSNLEGVATYSDHKLLLAEEATKEIIVLDMVSGGASKHKIKYKNRDKNSGIEGITFDHSNNRIFILNEKNPGKLIRLGNDFSVREKYDLKFAADYSGIFYENSSDQLWILSDQNKTVNKCTLTGDLIESYKIMASQPEGIAVTDSHIYVVCDAKATLYVYKKP